MAKLSTIVPCLWFNDQGEEAARFYCSIFPNSRIVALSHYSEVGREHHGKEPGSVMTVEFELDGQLFTALNGGPSFTFNEAISFQILCDTQEELDHYWEKLSAGGPPEAQMCGWLADRYGLSWQLVPSILPGLIKDPVKSQKVMTAVFGMKKLVIADLIAASER